MLSNFNSQPKRSTRCSENIILNIPENPYQPHGRIWWIGQSGKGKSRQELLCTNWCFCGFQFSSVLWSSKGSQRKITLVDIKKSSSKMSYIVSPCKDVTKHTHQLDLVHTFPTSPKPFAKVSVHCLYYHSFILQPPDSINHMYSIWYATGRVIISGITFGLENSIVTQ